MVGPTTSRIKRMSSTVAPPPPNPVDVLTKAAPAAFESADAMTFSRSVSFDVSRMTLTGYGAAAATTPAMSCCTSAWSPERSAPMFRTMSISWAPHATASRVSKAFAPGVPAPSGNPTTAHTRTPASGPRSSLARYTFPAFTHTL